MNAEKHARWDVTIRHGHPGVCCCLLQRCRGTECSTNAAKVARGGKP